MKNDGKVNIRGKEYETVAHRIHRFRKDHPDWFVLTEIVKLDEQLVVMKATIGCDVTHGRATYATGHAEEFRNASQINKTSALENAETSAIGRALAALGYGGTEFASANEVRNAIHQQNKKPPEPEGPTAQDVADRVEEIAGILGAAHADKVKAAARPLYAKHDFEGALKALDEYLAKFENDPKGEAA